MNSPQITPVTSLQRKYSDVLKKLAAGPVFLAQRSHPVAAVLSIGDYEQLVRDAEEGKRLKRMAQAEQDFAEMRQGNYVDMTDDIIQQRMQFAHAKGMRDLSPEEFMAKVRARDKEADEVSARMAAGDYVSLTPEQILALGDEGEQEKRKQRAKQYEQTFAEMRNDDAQERRWQQAEQDFVDMRNGQFIDMTDEIRAKAAF